MSKNDTRKTKDVLDDILEALLDIGESLAEIAANTRAGSVSEIGSLGLLDALHSDGGLSIPKGQIRTYGDPTILSGGEEGLK